MSQRARVSLDKLARNLERPGIDWSGGVRERREKGTACPGCLEESQPRSLRKTGGQPWECCASRFPETLLEIRNLTYNTAASQEEFRLCC